MKLLTLICVIASSSYLAAARHHKKPCEDVLSADHAITFKDFNGKNVKITSCGDVVNDYLALCKSSAKQACCQSCKQDLKCIDGLKGYKMRASDPFQGCGDFIAANPCKCRDRKMKKECCRSCSEVGDLSMCDCMDKLSKDSPATVTITDKDGNKDTKVLESCAEVMSGYDFLCAEKKFTGKKGACCQSCSGSCVDSRSFKKTVKAKNEEGKMVKCKKCSCARIEKMGTNHVMAACKNKKVKQNCCKMCSM